MSVPTRDDDDYLGPPIQVQLKMQSAKGLGFTVEDLWKASFTAISRPAPPSEGKILARKE